MLDMTAGSGRIDVELEHARVIDRGHLVQGLNHPGLPLCFLLGFGKPRVEIRGVPL